MFPHVACSQSTNHSGAPKRVALVQVSASFQALGRPNADIAMGVDTRQELDLRVGPAWDSRGTN